MSDLEPELDESLRQKFATLGDVVSAPLDASAELRIVARLQADTERRARTKRLRAWVGGAVGLAAAAAALMVWFSHDSAELAQPAPAACVWGDAPLRFAESTLALGAAGRVVLAPGAEAEVVMDPGCALRVQLKRGSLAAELGNLRPGSLRVETELGDVLVRGTTFSVDLEDELRVVLLSGAVELIDRDQVAARMSPGKALRRKAPRAAPALTDASAEDARRVNGLLHGTKQAPVPEQAPSSERIEGARAVQARETRPARSADLIAEAEAARRDGDAARARALYAQAEQKPGADAEVALLRHAGFELETGGAQEAERLLTEHQRRFPRSRLAAEAAWIHVRALQAIGDREAMRGAARNLTKQFAGTPQARAAQRLLEQP